MPRGSKAKYTDKQKRKARHIEAGYEERGVPEAEAERRAWATVNKETGGGNKSGSGRGVPDTNVSSRKGGRIGGRKSSGRTLRVRPPGKSPQRIAETADAKPAIAVFLERDPMRAILLRTTLVLGQQIREHVAAVAFHSQRDLQRLA